MVIPIRILEVVVVVVVVVVVAVVIVTVALSVVVVTVVVLEVGSAGLSGVFWSLQVFRDRRQLQARGCFFEVGSQCVGAHRISGFVFFVSMDSASLRVNNSIFWEAVWTCTKQMHPWFYQVSKWIAEIAKRQWHPKWMMSSERPKAKVPKS